LLDVNCSTKREIHSFEKLPPLPRLASVGFSVKKWCHFKTAATVLRGILRVAPNIREVKIGFDGSYFGHHTLGTATRACIKEFSEALSEIPEKKELFLFPALDCYITTFPIKLKKGSFETIYVSGRSPLLLDTVDYGLLRQQTKNAKSVKVCVRSLERPEGNAIEDKHNLYAACRILSNTGISAVQHMVVSKERSEKPVGTVTTETVEGVRHTETIRWNGVLHEYALA
jgi:hypothetical protein